MRASFAPLVSLAALAFTACGGPLYGPAEALTAPQEEAAASLLAAARTLQRAAGGQASAGEWLGVYGSIARLSERSLLRPRQAGFDATSLAALDTSCARGSPQTGFVFDGCHTAAGRLDGQVKAEAPGVRFELRTPSAAPRTTFRLEGPLAVDAERVSGRVVFAVSTEVLDQGFGVVLQGGPPGLETIVVFDLQHEAQGHARGTAEVLVSTRGGQDEALFTWADGALTVRNSADAR